MAAGRAIDVASIYLQRIDHRDALELFERVTCSSQQRATQFAHDRTAFQSLFFIGAQTELPLFAAVFIGRIRYTYQEAGADVDAVATQVTPTVGYQWTGPVTLSVSAGGTREYKDETGAIEDESTSTGGFAQLGAFYWKPELCGEILASYSMKTQFVWSRLRARHRVIGPFSLGGEFFRMGNKDFDATGIGILAEHRWRPITATIKLGANSTSSNDRGVYGGLEFYVPF